MVFEMSELLSRGDQDLVPVLLYLFHRIDHRCREGRPGCITIDDAHLMLLRAMSGEKVDEWLRTKAKQNACVLLATQGLEDVEHSRHRSVIVEQCPTKIFLPNAQARTAQSVQAYRALGLNTKQIDTIANLTPKKHYLYTSPLGSAVFDLRIGRAALAFIGVNERTDLRRIQGLFETFGPDFPHVWLSEKGYQQAAEWWRTHHNPTPPVEEDTDADLWKDEQLPKVVASNGHLSAAKPFISGLAGH
jgi:type IV secretion system protein VirB4